MAFLSPLLFLLFVSFYSSPLTAQVEGVWDKKVGAATQFIKDAWAEYDPEFKVNLFDFDLLEGISLGTKYHYQIYPAFTGQLYQRVDKWDINFDISALKVLGVDSPIFFNLDRGSSIVYVRQFTSKSKAALAMPVPFYKIPLKPEDVINDMNVGDFVSIPTGTAIGLGVRPNLSSGVLHLRPEISYVIGGRFDLQIIKKSASSVKMRFVSQQYKRLNIGIDLNLGPEIDVFSLNITNKSLEKLTRVKLVELGFTTEDGSLYVLDYDLDLNSDIGKKAFNIMIKGNLNLKKFLLTEKHSKDFWATDLSELDSLFLQEKIRTGSQYNQMAVNRTFKGANDYELKRKMGGFNLLFYQRESSGSSAVNVVTFMDQEDQVKQSLYYTYISRKENSKLFERYKEEVFRNHYVLVTADGKGNPVDRGFNDYGFRYDLRDKFMRVSEQIDFITLLYNNIPHSILQNISGLDQFRSDQRKLNARAVFRVLFHSQVLAFFSLYTEEQLRQRFIDYLDTKQVYSPNKNDVKNLINELFKMFTTFNDNQSSTKEEAQKISFKLMKLENKFSLFKKYGIGFLLHLIPDDSEKHLAYIFISLEDDDNSASIEFGTDPSSELYKSLLLMQFLIEGRPYDLNLVGYEG
jgi:hypothetical protein